MQKLIKREVKARFNWFTGRADGLISEFISPVEIIASYGHDNEVEVIREASILWHALWDTGATTSLIAPHIVEKCNLKPIGVLEVAVAGGIHRVSSYFVDIRLPNNVTIANMTLGCMELPSNIDVLIGMDIITLGDFAITNAGGRTVISFRIPSLVHVDFGRQDSPVVAPALFIEMDQPCPCGSGQSFRECCYKAKE